MKLKNIDNGNNFDFGKTSAAYAKYRDIYPKLMYENLTSLGVGTDGSNWLDIGTGTGVIPLNLYSNGANITGIDISAEQIKTAKILAAEKHIGNVNFIVSPAEATPFADNSFDCITAAQCFWYFDKDKAITEIKRIIQSGGTFIKIYMSYTLNDEIAKKSHELVKTMNKNWTPDASGSKDIYNHPFENGNVEVFECYLPFTRDSWHGRMLACRGTMASMDKKTLAEWNERHNKLLLNYPETFEVKHKVYIASYNL